METTTSPNEQPRQFAESMNIFLMLFLIWALQMPVYLYFIYDPVEPTTWMFGETLLAAKMLQNGPLLGVSLLIAGLLIFQYLPVVQGKYKQNFGWQAVEMRGARWVIGTVCLVLAYNHFSADVNLYVNRTFILDRTLMVCLALLVYVNPLFVLPFAVYLMNYNLYLRIPLSTGSHTHYHFVTHFLLMVGLFSLLRLFTRRIKLWHVVVIAIASQCATYYFSGYAKLFMDGPPLRWLWENETIYMIVEANTAHHWLGWLPSPVWGAVLQIFSVSGVVFNVFTVIAEMGVIFAFFRNRRIGLVALGLMVLFHLGVYATTRLFFRMWLLALIAYIVLIALQPKESEALRGMYHPVTWVVSVLIMITGVWLPYHVPYAWWNTGLYVTVSYDAVTESDERYPLPPDVFYPYDNLHASRDLALIDAPMPSFTGSGDYPFVQQLDTIGIDDPEAVRAFIEENGESYFDPEARELFTNFIAQSLTHYQTRGYEKSFIRYLPQIPPHYNSARAPSIEYYDGQAPLEAVEVIYRIDTYNIETGTVTRIVTAPIMTIDLDTAR